MDANNNDNTPQCSDENESLCDSAEVSMDNSRNSSVTRSKSSESGSGQSGTRKPREKGLAVIARIRPPIKNETPIPADGQTCIMRVPDCDKIQATNPRDGFVTLHDFDTVLGPDATQDDCYHAIERNVTQTLRGIPLLLMAYGVTSAGKTYTIFGDLVNTDDGSSNGANSLCSGTGSGSSSRIPRPSSVNTRSSSNSSLSQLLSPRPFSRQKTSYTQLLQKIGDDGYIKSNITVNPRIVGSVSTEKSGLFGHTVRALMNENTELAAEIANGLVEVRVSAVQIYNGVVMDLLRLATRTYGSQDTKNNGLTFANSLNRLAGSNANNNAINMSYGNSNSGDSDEAVLQVYSTANPIPNRSWKVCKTSDEVLGVTKMALLCREVSATSINATSSRSHCWVTIAIERVSPEATQQPTHLSFLDLAGSEPSSAALNQKEHAEGNNIRLDLFAIGNILTALKKSSSVSNAPVFRQSPLTLLLRPYLQLIQVEQATKDHQAKFILPSNVIMFMNFHTREDGFNANKEALQLGLVASSIKSYADTQSKYLLERKNAAAMVTVMAEATQNAPQNNGIMTPRLQFKKNNRLNGASSLAVSDGSGGYKTPNISGGPHSIRSGAINNFSSTPKIDALVKNIQNGANANCTTVQIPYEDWCEVLRQVEFLSNQLSSVVNSIDCTIKTERLNMHAELMAYMESTILQEKAIFMDQACALDETITDLRTENINLLKKLIEYQNELNTAYEKLGQNKKNDVSEIDFKKKLDTQLEHCSNCEALARELRDKNSKLASSEWKYKTIQEESKYLVQENKELKDRVLTLKNALDESEKTVVKLEQATKMPNIIDDGENVVPRNMYGSALNTEALKDSQIRM